MVPRTKQLTKDKWSWQPTLNNDIKYLATRRLPRGKLEVTAYKSTEGFGAHTRDERTVSRNDTSVEVNCLVCKL